MIEEEQARAADPELANALALAERCWGDWTEAGIKATVAAQDKARYPAALAKVTACRRAYHSAENALLQLRKKRGLTS